tara:strand:+ start:257 stop:511 length:255 start_codon:yes stop_codon:yes gene_type:complete
LLEEEYIGIIAAKLPKLKINEKIFAKAKTKKYIPTFFTSSSLIITATTNKLEITPRAFIKLSCIMVLKLTTPNEELINSLIFEK